MARLSGRPAPLGSGLIRPTDGIIWLSGGFGWAWIAFSGPRAGSFGTRAGWHGDAVRWIEVCFCGEPLEEERPYWEEYFELVRVQDAHSRRLCRDLNGTESWACCDCDCTARLEARMEGWGRPFLEVLREEVCTQASDRLSSTG